MVLPGCYSKVLAEAQRLSAALPQAVLGAEWAVGGGLSWRVEMGSSLWLCRTPRNKVLVSRDPIVELEVTGDWTGREIGAASRRTLCFVDPRGGAVWQ